MRRLEGILGRYGWRTPFVVLAVAGVRLGRAREIAVLAWLRLTTRGGKGSKISWGRGVEVSPGSYLAVGNGVHVGPRCTFEIGVNPAGHVSIGADTWISHDCHIASHGRIDIGAHVLIGEFVSIRDTSHAYADTVRPMKQQPDIIGRIRIEDDVWIGRGTVVLGRPEGLTIGRGAVVGANSVISRSVPRYTVVAGAPARPIKVRGGDAELPETSGLL